MLVNHDFETDAGRESPASSGRGKRTSLVPRLHVDEIVTVARHLSERDRALVHAVYERGLPLKAVAAIHETRPGRLHHRLRRVLKRLRSPLFQLVLREKCAWPADRRAIAEGAVLRGEKQRDIARALGISLHRVRTELEHLKALAGVTRASGEE